ncbi:DUF6064 family protein [Thalassomonas haliotis]|uniref:MFS transporter permease n=1 Tax=Thalassomonas haliotis TaxID=485448 RepID=A0ABY7VAD0_9GAMM|nr:DUF6064 family protein [Thalassomonas haliotis]WDE10609.1 hypothetical protein H3N35_20465 [Thalassomonas haliotis]
MFESLFFFLADFLMFTPENYLRLISHYNRETWPLPLLALLLGTANLVLIKSRYLHRDRLINLSLVCHWLWVGIVFHYYYFSAINWAAPAFALLFVLQAVQLAIFGVLQNKIHYQTPLTQLSYIGLFIYLFALLFYPGITAYLHQDWQQAGYYGVSADATCLATMGLLLMTKSRSRYYLILPLIWCLLSAAMAWVMAFKQASILLLIAVFICLFKTFPAPIYRKKQPRT